MKNRLFTIILMLFLSVGILSAAALAAPSAGGKGLSPDDPMVVPTDGMLIKGTTYYGISKAWFEEINPDKATMYFSVKVPSSVTSIINDGFRDSYTTDKKNNGAVTSYDNLGRYNMVAIDFSEATSLTTINNQAAMRCSYLSGVLDLSHTKITTLGKSAFSGCTGLTGVILPDTLEVLGEADGSAGSVFNGCTGLQFVRTARSDKDAVFELPIEGSGAFSVAPSGDTFLFQGGYQKHGKFYFLTAQDNRLGQKQKAVPTCDGKKVAVERCSLLRSRMLFLGKNGVLYGGVLGESEE